MGRLAIRNLLRHRLRSSLTGLGIAVATAILFDMILLGGGIVDSFRAQLEAFGFGLRATPKGTLPLATEATIPEGSALAEQIAGEPGVDRVGAMLGGTVYLQAAGATVRDSAIACFAVGVDSVSRAIYRMRPGMRGERDGIEGIIVNPNVARRLELAPGDTVAVASERDPHTRALVGVRRFAVAAVADFFFDSRKQRSIALPLSVLQEMEGLRERDGVSLLMISVEPGSDAAAVRDALASRFPRVDVLSVEEMVASIRSRLSYFQQFSRILGTISLVVNFLLIATIVTISVNERFGEIAVLRAIGLQQRRILGLVLTEALLLTIVAGIAGIGLGWLLSGYLDAILRDSPGLPASVSFFVLRPAAFVQTGLFVVGVGLFAGLTASAIAARGRIAETLRREAT
ncbi:MAG: FtsX-like permease family protein [Candidatus Eisenbacteria bacterium]|nr:FtsX-like permease family protein [Candidatus Latescibacterota bacterium]MBD3301046.1 FtsX-like permease family protein [Candidatus Eisenbacteria bacterium]